MVEEQFFTNNDGEFQLDLSTKALENSFLRRKARKTFLRRVIMNLSSKYNIRRGLVWVWAAYHVPIGLAAFFKIPGMYNPSAFMIGAKGSEKPGEGTTGIENLVSAYSGLAYIASSIGIIYGEINGSRTAKITASIFPIVFHSLLGIRYLLFNGNNGHGFNPKVISMSTAGYGHIVFGAISFGLYYFAEDSPSINK